MRKRHFPPQHDGRPLAKWCSHLSMPLMAAKFALAMRPELKHLKDKEELTGTEARQVAAVVAKTPGP